MHSELLESHSQIYTHSQGFLDISNMEARPKQTEEINSEKTEMLQKAKEKLRETKMNILEQWKKKYASTKQKDAKKKGHSENKKGLLKNFVKKNTF